MRIFITLLLGIALLFIACRKSNTNNCPTTTYQYTFSKNAELDTSRTPANWLLVSTKTGSKLVFNYTRNEQTCPEIADGGSTDILFFEVDPAVTSFTYDAASFQAFMVYFRRICFCPEIGFTVPTGGNIKGNRVDDNSWKIEFELVINGGEHIKTSAVFRLQ